MKRGKIAAFAAIALATALSGTSHACLGCGDGDSYVQVGPHPFTGACEWRSATASSQGIDATLYGYALVGDGTAAGVTIRCWLEYSSGSNNGQNVPNTTTQNGAPGSAASTAKQIFVPFVPTRVCAYAQALFVTPDPPQTYLTPNCSVA